MVHRRSDRDGRGEVLQVRAGDGRSWAESPELGQVEFIGKSWSGDRWKEGRKEERTRMLQTPYQVRTGEKIGFATST